MEQEDQATQPDSCSAENSRSGDPSYAQDTLEFAIYLLAIGKGDIKERLISAFTHLAPVTRADFPPELQKDFDWIVHSLTKNETKYERRLRDGEFVQESTGTLLATVRYMRHAKAIEIAKRMYELNERLKESLKIKEEGTQV